MLQRTTEETILSGSDARDNPGNETLDVVILGAGLSGILTALHLTAPKEPVVDDGRVGARSDGGNGGLAIAIVESRGAVGGRMLLGGRRGGLPGTASTDSSFALDVFGTGVAPLIAEISRLLTSDERTDFENHLKASATHEGTTSSAFVREAQGCFVVRKEFTPGPLICKGPSECLTRTAAHSLGLILGADPNCVLSDEPNWKALRKPLRDELKPFFETVAGGDFEKSRVGFLATELKRSFGLGDEQSDTARGLRMVPVASLCQWLAGLLERRGVRLLLGAKADRAQRVENGDVISVPLVTADRGAVTLVTRFLVATVPLAQSLTVVPREWLTPAESRFVTRVRPRSAVVLQIANPHSDPDFASLDIASVPLGRMFFPVERVQAVTSVDGGVVFYAWLDYEVSLQAPGVREVLGRIKRAFKRVFPGTELESFARISGGGAVAGGQPLERRDLGERLVLIPVAQSVPPTVTEFVDLEASAVSRSGSNLSGTSFCFVGEHGAQPLDAWSSVVQSAGGGAQMVLERLKQRSPAAGMSKKQVRASDGDLSLS